MLEKVPKQKVPYIMDCLPSIQEFLMRDQFNVDVL